jgi:adenylosuccinate synthase
MQNAHSFYQQWKILRNRKYTRPQISLNIFHKIKIILCIFSDHNKTKLEMSNKGNFRIVTNSWGINILLNDKIKRQTEKFLETNEMEAQHPKLCRLQQIQYQEGNLQ